MSNERELTENLEVTNKLLFDMVMNQKSANSSLIKTTIVVSICFCIIIVSMVIGFFIYESNFEVLTTDSSSTVTQEAELEGDGNIVMNNSGDLNYGTDESKTDN